MYEFTNQIRPRDEAEKAANLKMIEETKTAEDIVKLMRKEILIEDRFKIDRKSVV